MLSVIGATAFGTLILARASLAPEVAANASTRAARIGSIGAAVCLVAGIARLFAQTAAVQNVDAIRLITDTTWGTGWIIQIAASVVALAAFTLAHRANAAWFVAAIATVVLALSPALSGHALSAALEPLPIVAHWLHVLAAGGWLGSLFLVLAAGLPATALAPDDRARNARALINAFSPPALAFAATLLLTGAFVSWIHLGSLAAMLSSSYGRTLSLKLATLALVVALGAYNFLRAKPDLRDESGVAKLRRSARAELAFAALVLLVTAVLVATPPPADAALPVASLTHLP
jgi:copper transport protein